MYFRGPNYPIRVDNWELAYSPMGPAVTPFMESVSKTLNLTARGFQSRSDLEIHLKLSEYPFACVQFDDSLALNASLPAHLSYDIRFPSMRRWGNGNWNTDRVNRHISASVLWGAMSPDAFSPYISEGFLAIQNVISMEFIREKSQNREPIPQVAIQRQPFPADRMDFAVNLMGDLLSAVLIISFLPSCMNMTKVTRIRALILIGFAI